MSDYYDFNKRSYFTHLGELRMLLADLLDETEVCVGGCLGAYIHFADDKPLVSFDDEELNYAYPPRYFDEDELYLKKQEQEDYEYGNRQQMIDTGPQFIVVGNKLMRTFLADDGSWDYELYDVSLSVVDSGQLGGRYDPDGNPWDESCLSDDWVNITRNETIETVLEWNGLTNEKVYHLSPIAMEALCGVA